MAKKSKFMGTISTNMTPGAQTVNIAPPAHVMRANVAGKAVPSRPRYKNAGAQARVKSGSARSY